MRLFAIAAGLCLAAGTAQAQTETPSNPYAYKCGAYLEAQQSEQKGQANAMLFWATGYLQARLGPIPTTTFNAATFGNDLRDVHGALLQICPNIPDMMLATFMDNFASDFEKSAKPVQ